MIFNIKVLYLFLMLPCLKQYINDVDIGPAFLYKVGLSHEHVLKGFVIFLKKDTVSSLWPSIKT